MFLTAGAFLWMAEREALVWTLGSKNRRERFFTTEGSPKGKAQGSAA
jgi:hypothetical protein